MQIRQIQILAGSITSVKQTDHLLDATAITILHSA